jgi:hypothetical protein
MILNFCVDIDVVRIVRADQEIITAVNKEFLFCTYAVMNNSMGITYDSRRSLLDEDTVRIQS